METLIKLVTEKAGLSEEKAKTVIETVVGYFKEKLPAPIASQLDSVISGEGVAGKMGEAAKGIGGMFGEK